ncbi:hypothetical protein QE431_001045 [Flavobacterium sp. SORGH_AS 622]|nr:hypothetical protein [Flavobacterium sp. SORGH_AS_0622]
MGLFTQDVCEIKSLKDFLDCLKINSNKKRSNYLERFFYQD